MSMTVSDQPRGAPENSSLCHVWQSVLVIALLLWAGIVFGQTPAAFEFVALENIFANPPPANQVSPYGIVVSSSRLKFRVPPPDSRAAQQDYFLYQTQVKVNGRAFYRLALGNFKTSRSARVALQRVRQTFADAWVYKRTQPELEALVKKLKRGRRTTTAQAAAPATSETGSVRVGPPVGSDSVDALLEKARQEFIDGNYSRVIAITDRVTTGGSLEQVREALELAGITRERERKFAQAIVLYEALLDTKPAPEQATRIQGRLQGIRTMDLDPKSRIEPDRAEERSDWNYRGILLQFYQDDQIDREDEDRFSVNRALTTDVDLFVQRRTDQDDLVFRIDAGLVREFLAEETERRVSRASVEYARDEFRIIGGRQSRTLSGVYGRFDGLTFQDLSHSGFRTSYAYGFLVQSSFDGIESNRPFIGANLDFSPTPWFESSLYLINQEIYDLTDREAVGSELRFQNDSGFLFANIDYDTFYDELSNLSIISNYRPNTTWAINLTLTTGFSPTLATINALQGQAVDDVDDLKELLYQLAEDRTARSDNIFIGTSYRFDATRQLYVNLSSLRLKATDSSGGVESVPESKDNQISFEYSFQGLLFERDYASLGARFSDSANSKTNSLRARTRFNTGGISYDPRLQLDQRENKNDDSVQLIIKPSVKVKKQFNRRFTLEGTFEIEYSDLDIPEFDKQYTYSVYFGYFYLF